MTTSSTSGFRELDEILKSMPKATAKNVLKRSAIKVMKRIEEGMAARAPKDDGTLAGSMRTQVVKATRQRGQVRFNAQSGVEVITGPAPEGKMNRANAGFQEFGTVKMAANAYARPTADAENENVVEDLKGILAGEIDKAVARAARRAARAGNG